jgi:gluconate 2-dehydrogenase alpha chain
MSDTADAIVVGLGSAGGILAERLTGAGLRVVALEKGPDYEQADFEIKHDEIRYYGRGAIVANTSTDPVRRPGALLRARGVRAGRGRRGRQPAGGCAAYRFREAEFLMRSAIVARFGAGALPDDTTLVDWRLT